MCQHNWADFRVKEEKSLRYYKENQVESILGSQDVADKFPRICLSKSEWEKWVSAS